MDTPGADGGWSAWDRRFCVLVLADRGAIDKAFAVRWQQAVKMLRQLREAYHAIGDVAGFGTYLDRLRDRHKRKIAFIAKLDHANL